MNNEFVTALRRATLLWRQCFDAELRATGQTLGRARALIALARHPEGMLQRDLAAELMIEHPTMVRLLDGLERQRLITREAAPNDRRANHIRLTPESRPLVDAVQQQFDQLRDRMLQSVPPADLRKAIGVLEAIAANLDDAVAARSEARSGKGEPEA